MKLILVFIIVITLLVTTTNVAGKSLQGIEDNEVVVVVDDDIGDDPQEDLDFSSREEAISQSLQDVNQDLIQSGLQKLQREEEHNSKRYQQIIDNANPKVVEAFHATIKKLYTNHPEAARLMYQYFKMERKGLVDDKEFERVDKELSKYEEWRSFWNIWIQIFADYMKNYG